MAGKASALKSIEEHPVLDAGELKRNASVLWRSKDMAKNEPRMVDISPKREKISPFIV